MDVQPLLGDDYVRSLAGAAAVPKHRIARWYLDRLAQLRRAGEYDLVWIYVELFPFLPRQVDQLIFGSGTPVIVDFDDAFFLSYDQAERPFVRHLLSGKLGNLLKEASAATCGNAYLRDYASTYCHNSIVVPTVVDTDRYLPASAERNVLR